MRNGRFERPRKTGWVWFSGGDREVNVKEREKPGSFALNAALTPSDLLSALLPGWHAQNWRSHAATLQTAAFLRVIGILGS